MTIGQLIQAIALFLRQARLEYASHRDSVGTLLDMDDGLMNQRKLGILKVILEELIDLRNAARRLIVAMKRWLRLLPQLPTEINALVTAFQVPFEPTMNAIKQFEKDVDASVQLLKEIIAEYE
ncbi:hypothetical protein EIP75_04695 [Aquabacterium soli]|uniref:Uncharacterized protein n=1 Tax=Aquabacterium soli TaxID=2493092 RepID=A0A3R8YQ75_9BURK|nr:hypothetical protein [Aquabacterium soli]RRS05510.1 hypothetical protein EIP75_04695 [Aquabacterium soli]